MIELRSVSKTYRMGDEDVHALRDVSLKIEPGEFVAIMGPSGSGKSTMLHILGFLDRPDSGAYLLGGKDISCVGDDQLALLRNKIAGFVFQQFHLLPRLSAVDNVSLPLIYAGRQDLKTHALEKIESVGLSARALHQPNELSGGERQRIAIARSLVNDPLIIFADEPTGNLDTKSESQIMAILKDLNSQGKTVVMVTHEREVAEHAKRIIMMRDGKILSDVTKERGAFSVKPDLAPVTQALSKQSSSFGRAEISDHVRQSIQAIFSNRLRSLLSMLGILIGVAAVIAMLALGEGAKDSIKQRLSSLGTNLLLVRSGSSHMGGVSLAAGTVTRFTLSDADEMMKLDSVRYVAGVVSARLQMVFEANNWNSQVQGVGIHYAQMHASLPTLGRFFTDNEMTSRARVAVLGKTVVRELFGDEDPLGKTVRINRIAFEVIGVLPEKGATGFRDEDDVVLIPLTTAMYRLMGRQYVDSIDVEVKDESMMDEAEDALSALIIKRHRLTKDKEDSFQIRNMADIQAALTSTTQTMTMLLGSIAAISLLVGGIGIMNIMLVSVTERTREIGLRKAIGARKSDITTQFLIESVIMTLAGGCLGIMVGIGVAVLLSVVAGWATHISLMSVLMAVVFSVGVGIVFGLRPAIKAAQLNPIEALRYE